MTSPIRRRLCQLRDDESGQSLVYIAIGFMTFAAAAAGPRGQGANVRVANFLGFFADSLEGDAVSGYITDIPGVTDATAGPAPASAFPKTIRLVQ